MDGNDDDADSWPSYAIVPPEENQLVGTDEANEQEQVPYSSFSIFPPEDDHVVGNEADDDNVSRMYFDFSLLQVTTLELTVVFVFKLCRYMCTVKMNMSTPIQRERRRNRALIT